MQFQILWTAMSLALGVEIQGEIIRGLPCIKRLNQLFCPTAGNRYPGLVYHSPEICLKLASKDGNLKTN